MQPQVPPFTDKICHLKLYFFIKYIFKFKQIINFIIFVSLIGSVIVHIDESCDVRDTFQKMLMLDLQISINKTCWQRVSDLIK